MSKQEQLNSKQSLLQKLKRKYFWEQKFNEVGKFLVIAIGGVFIPYFFGKFLYLITPIVSRQSFWGEMTTCLYWLAGFLPIVMIAVIVCMIDALVKSIKKWIKRNLDKAESRARKELRMEAGKRKV